MEGKQEERKVNGKGRRKKQRAMEVVISNRAEFICPSISWI